MSDGSALRVCGAAAENARQASSVGVIGTDGIECRWMTAEAEPQQLPGMIFGQTWQQFGLS